jgi:hypothetical protein
VQDEAETSEHRVQPHSNLDPQQLPLASLKNLQPDAKTSIFISEVETMLIGSHQVIFKRYFQTPMKIKW